MVSYENCRMTWRRHCRVLYDTRWLHQKRSSSALGYTGALSWFEQEHARQMVKSAA